MKPGRDGRQGQAAVAQVMPIANDAFAFRATGGFTAAGHVRVTGSGSDTVIQVNTDTNLTTAEMEIAVKDGDVSPSQWVAGDFIL